MEPRFEFKLSVPQLDVGYWREVVQLKMKAKKTGGGSREGRGGGA